MKKFVVIGLGTFGFHLAKTLEQNNCEVICVDISRDRVESIKEFVSQAMVGDATNKDFLSSLMLNNLDAAIISIGQDMSASTLVALYLKEAGMKNVIVRAISEDHGTILKKIGVNEVLHPETEAASKLASRLAMRNALDFLPLSENHGIIEVKPPKSFIGKSLKELQISSRYHSQVIALKGVYSDKNGNQEKIKIPPSAEDIIDNTTVMILVGNLDDIEKIQKLS